MCFSTEASFIGGTIITAIGVATIRKVHKPSQIVFASIPLFFGIQQIAEGFVWLSLQNPDYGGLLKPATYMFLIMAEVFWPFMTPLAVLHMEKNEKRRIYLKILLATHQTGKLSLVIFCLRLQFTAKSCLMSFFSHIGHAVDQLYTKGDVAGIEIAAIFLH